MPSIRAATGFAIDEASLIEVLKQLAQCGAISAWSMPVRRCAWNTS